MKFRKNKETIEFENYKGRKCPFINEILSACHCSDMRSTNIENAIYYCGANFIECPVYWKLKKDGKAPLAKSVSANRKAIGL